MKEFNCEEKGEFYGCLDYFSQSGKYNKQQYKVIAMLSI
jgi:hypothetical protein